MLPWLARFVMMAAMIAANLVKNQEPQQGKQARSFALSHHGFTGMATGSSSSRTP